MNTFIPEHQTKYPSKAMKFISQSYSYSHALDIDHSYIRTYIVHSCVNLYNLFYLVDLYICTLKEQG